MALNDKNEAIAELESGIRAIDRVLTILDDLKLGASMKQRKRMVKIMASLSDRRQIAAAFVSHMKGAEVEVHPSPPDAYAKLDAVLKELQEFQQATMTVKRGLQVAGSLADAMKEAREGVSGRTV